MEHINWSRLGHAIDFYKSLGFKYIETPWYVESDTCMITCPSKDGLVEIKDNAEDWAFVGSAEQGFLQRQKDGALSGTNYVSCGPCFRKEPVFDELHHPQFMKVELFVRCETEKSALYAAKELINRAYKYTLLYEVKAEAIETTEGRDLMLGSIEIGSYGARYHKDVGWWAYGTGLAEPRFTQALKKVKEDV